MNAKEGEERTNLILLKTRFENLEMVVKHAMHALKGKLLRAHQNDLLLLAEIRTRGSAIARYGMWFKGQRRSRPGETEAIWNEHWDWVVEGAGCAPLTRPFIPQMEKVSSSNYGQGGTVCYVSSDDGAIFAKRKLLEPFIWQ